MGVNHLSGQKRVEADKQRKRQAVLQQAVKAAQERCRESCGYVRQQQYSLETWRRQAMLNAQLGDAVQLAEMLDQLPRSLPGDNAPPGKESESDSDAEFRDALEKLVEADTDDKQSTEPAGEASDL